MFATTRALPRRMTLLLHALVTTVCVGLWLTATAGCGGGQTEEVTPEERFARLGERAYRNQCATCHQMDGQGVPGIYPPLHGTEWVIGDKGRLIRLTLDGLRGPIEVQGETYDAVMTPQGYLTDEQIAAVLTYVRSHFGNEASAVTTDEVTAVRLADEHEGFWTADELRDVTGIPDVELP